MGDFNSCNSLWGDDIINQSGRIIEQLLITENINLMNDGSPTRFCVQTGNMTCLERHCAHQMLGLILSGQHLANYLRVIICPLSLVNRKTETSQVQPPSCGLESL